MTTLFVTCFIAGLGLSVVSFVSGVLRLASPRRGRSAMINAAAITAFLTWFGGGGLLLERLTPWSLALSVAGASVIGLVGGALINSVINTLAQKESLAESLTMIGVIAKTVVPIRAGDGTGEIIFTHSGTRRVAAARSDDGSAIEKGTEVVVTRYERGIAYVTTWEELSKEGSW